MFKFLPKKPNYKMNKGVVDDSINQNNTLLQHSSTLLAATLSGVLLLSGCQQQAETQPAPEDSQSVEKTSTEDSQPMRPSDSAATRIKQFQLSMSRKHKGYSVVYKQSMNPYKPLIAQIVRIHCC